MSVRRIDRTRAAWWYCLVVALFLSIRALSTLVVGAHFTLPGDGWRSIWQLALAAILALGVAVSPTTRAAVATAGVVYCAATVWERVGNTLDKQAVRRPFSAMPMVARKPAPPAPTTTTS